MFDIRKVECGFCLEVLQKPRQCRAAHLFCERCFEKQSNPVCPGGCGRTLTSKNVARCPSLIEEILATHSPCKYQESGCDFFRTTSELDVHVKDCEHVPQKCPGCTSSFPRHNFEHHKSACRSEALNSLAGALKTAAPWVHGKENAAKFSELSQLFEPFAKQLNLVLASSKHKRKLSEIAEAGDENLDMNVQNGGGPSAKVGRRQQGGSDDNWLNVGKAVQVFCEDDEGDSAWYIAKVKEARRVEGSEQVLVSYVGDKEQEYDAWVPVGDRERLRPWVPEKDNRVKALCDEDGEYRTARVVLVLSLERRVKLTWEEGRRKGRLASKQFDELDPVSESETESDSDGADED